MHLLLTDRLTCPRCGPTFGLILRADRLEHRRVHDGVLGCPNCRDGFPIRGGLADLRAPPRSEELPDGLVGAPPEAPDSDAWREADRLTALLGMVRGPGTVALVGGPARHGARLAASVDDLQVVGVDPDLALWPDAPGVSRLVSAPGLPFFTGMLRGAVVDGRLGRRWLEEASRVVAPKGRLVVTTAPEGAAEALVDLGLQVLAEEAETVVATRG